MKTALVHYKKWVDSEHPLMDGSWSKRSMVVEVLKLTDLNNMFDHITKIEILERT